MQYSKDITHLENSPKGKIHSFSDIADAVPTQKCLETSLLPW